jgi:hypothetical protein
MLLALTAAPAMPFRSPGAPSVDRAELKGGSPILSSHMGHRRLRFRTLVLECTFSKSWQGAIARQPGITNGKAQGVR